MPRPARPWFRPLKPDEHFEMSSDMLDSFEVYKLSPVEFRRQMIAASYGEKNAVSPFFRVRPNRPPAHEWRALREAVFARDDYTCQYCGRRGVRLECDHVHPISRGGGNELSNLKTACYECNRAKAGKPAEAWAG